MLQPGLGTSGTAGDECDNQPCLHSQASRKPSNQGSLIQSQLSLSKPISDYQMEDSAHNCTFLAWFYLYVGNLVVQDLQLDNYSTVSKAGRKLQDLERHLCKVSLFSASSLLGG